MFLLLSSSNQRPQKQFIQAVAHDRRGMGNTHVGGKPSGQSAFFHQQAGQKGGGHIGTGDGQAEHHPPKGRS